METENKFMIARDLGKREWGVTADGHREYFWGDKMFWNQRVVMVAQLCEYTKNH